MKKGKTIATCVLCILALLFSNVAIAETVAGDLSARFADQITLQYEGKDYRVRQRLTTMLFLAMIDDAETEEADGLISEELIAVDSEKTDDVASEENGDMISEEPGKKAAFVGILAVDDEAKTIAMMQIPPRTVVQFAEEQVLARDVYGMVEEDQGCIETLNAINALFPEPLIENYLALDMAGLNAIEGFEMPDTQDMEEEEAVKTRLKALKTYVEQECSADDLNRIITSLSDYTITEMKTGALMKIADKAERYEVLPTYYLAGSYIDGEAEEVFVPDEAELIRQLIEIFYEESFW